MALRVVFMENNIGAFTVTKTPEKVSHLWESKKIVIYFVSIFVAGQNPLQVEFVFTCRLNTHSDELKKLFLEPKLSLGKN